jgi:hypothetical protein
VRPIGVTPDTEAARLTGKVECRLCGDESGELIFGFGSWAAGHSLQTKDGLRLGLFDTCPRIDTTRPIAPF